MSDNAGPTAYLGVRWPRRRLVTSMTRRSMTRRVMGHSILFRLQTSASSLSERVLVIHTTGLVMAIRRR